jgi:hypothetical protein
MLLFLDGKSIDEKRKVLRTIVDNFVEMWDEPLFEWEICIGIEDLILR